MYRIRESKTLLYLGTMAEAAAARHGDMTITLDHEMDALPGSGTTVTFAALAGHVGDLANRLWAAGVRPGEHVAIYKTASFDSCVIACAVARIGAAAAGISPHLDGDTVAAMLARLDNPTLVTDGAKLDTTLTGVPLRELTARVISASGARDGAVDLAELAGAPQRPPVSLHPDQPALMTHTSGTTGIPKLVVHSARSLGARYAWQDRVVSLIRKRETVAMHVSYVHSRMYLGLAVLLDRGMPMVFMNDARPDKVADMLVKHRPGVLETHPNSFVEWEEMLSDPRGPIGTVRYFNSTFDAIAPRTMLKFLEASDRRRPVFLQVYGQSECGPLVARLHTRRTARKADGRCQGYATPFMTKFRLVSRNGKRPSRKNPGYIDVATAGRALTYHGEAERFARQVHGEWWRGGDVGFRSKWGCLHLLDREVDVIPTIGSTLEVEDIVLGRLPELTELVLVPGPNKEPIPVACTRGDRPLDGARWRAAVADQAPMPDPVVIPLTAMPRTATAKIKRLELAKRLAERTDLAS